MNYLSNILSVVLFSFTAVVQSAPIPIDKIFRDPEVLSVEVSPNGKQLVAFNSYKKYDYLILIQVDTRKQKKLVKLNKNDSRINDYQWIDNDTLFVSYSNNLNNKELFVDINNENGKIELELSYIRSDGYIVDPLINIDNTVLYAKKTWTRRRFIYKLYTATTHQISQDDFKKASKFKNTLDNAFFYFNDNKNKRMMASTFSDDTLAFWYLDTSSKTWVKYFSIEDRSYDFVPIGFLPGNKIAVLSNKNTDLMSLNEFDIATQKFGRVIYQHEMYDLSSAEFSPKGDLQSVSYYDHSKLAVKYFSIEDKKVSSQIKNAFQDKQIYIISKLDNKNTRLVYVFSSNDPGRYYFIDYNTLEKEEILIAFPDLDDYQLSESEVFVVEGKNTKIEAILTTPQSDSNGVLLVVPHGGPIGVRNYNSYNRETQYFVNRGFSVLNVNFRGSSGFGKKFLDSGKGQFGKSIESDITSAVNFIRKKYTFEKMCSMGSSYGGYSAMMLAIAHPDDYQCVVALFGIYDLPLLFNRSNLKIQESYIKAVSKVVGEYSESLVNVSPFYLAEKLKSPVLLIAGKADEIAGFEQSNRMKYRLNQLSLDNDHIFYKNAEHGHKSWMGDRHQYAYIYNYLMNKLELEQDLTDDFKAVLADESMIIADIFDTGKYVDTDESRALKYYRLAAKYGDNRARFNVGSYFHSGTVVDRNYEEAMKWYLISSNDGYQSASFRLGEMYLHEKYGEIDEQKSFEMFSKAREQGHPLAQFELASAYCRGIGVETDFEQCFSLLKISEEDNKKDKLNKFTKREIRAKRYSTMNAIYKNVDFDDNEMILLKSYLKEEYEIRDVSFSVDITYAGIYKYSYRKRARKTDNIELALNQTFGISVKFNMNNDANLEKNDIFAVLIRWTLVKENSTIREEKIRKIILFDLNGDTDFHYSINNEDDMQEGKWRLELFTLGQVRILSKTFNVSYDN